MVRDGVESSSAWHAKVSQSRTLAIGSSDLQVLHRNLQFGPEGVENGDLASMGFRFTIELIGVYRVWMRTRKSISRDAKSAWSDFRLGSRQGRYIDEGGECDVGRMGHWCDLRGVVDAARTIWTHKTGVFILSLSL